MEFILSHSHPSGALQPIQADMDLAKKLKKDGKLLDIEILDHIIIASEAYYSFADKGSCSPLLFMAIPKIMVLGCNSPSKFHTGDESGPLAEILSSDSEASFKRLQNYWQRTRFD